MNITSRIKSFLYGHPLIRIAFQPFLYPRRAFLRTWLLRRSLEKVIESLFAEPPLLSVPEFEGNFHVDPRSHLFSRLLFNGNYEPLLAELARCLIDSNRDVVDIGANVGFYTVLSARHTRGRVLAIEPTDNALRLLRRNIVHNELVNKVLVFEGVVSDVSGEVTLSFLNGKEEYSSIEVIRHPSVVGVIRSCKTVVSNTLDQLVKQFVLDPGFLKIDVEGAEHKVYAGASEVLSNARPIVLSEFSQRLLQSG